MRTQTPYKKDLSVIFLLAFADFLGVCSYRRPVKYFSVGRMDEGEVSPLSPLAVLHNRYRNGWYFETAGRRYSIFGAFSIITVWRICHL
jgi:hypothetical protein